MAKVTIEVPNDVLAALRSEEEVGASPAAVVARVVARAARNVLRGTHRASEKGKLAHTDYGELERAQQAADKAAEDTADAAVEVVLRGVK